MSVTDQMDQTSPESPEALITELARALNTALLAASTEQDRVLTIVQALERDMVEVVAGVKWLKAERVTLRAERDRLRTALQRIADGGDGSDPCGCEHDDENCCARRLDYCCPMCIATVALMDSEHLT